MPRIARKPAKEESDEEESIPTSPIVMEEEQPVPKILQTKTLGKPLGTRHNAKMTEKKIEQLRNARKVLEENRIIRKTVKEGKLTVDDARVIEEDRVIRGSKLPPTSPIKTKKSVAPKIIDEYEPEEEESEEYEEPEPVKHQTKQFKPKQPKQEVDVEVAPVSKRSYKPKQRQIQESDDVVDEVYERPKPRVNNRNTEEENAKLRLSKLLGLWN